MLTTTDNVFASPAAVDRQVNARPAPIIRERIFGIPVDTEILFADAQNQYRAPIEKRQRQLIIKLSFLRSFLHPGEKLLLATTAFSPLRWVEQLLTAGLFLDLERAIVIFTNYRILHIPVDRRGCYRRSIAQIRYRDIRSIALRRGALEVVYKKGAIEKFKAVAYAERRKIKQLLPALPLTKQVVSPVTRVQLCPQCTRSLIKPVVRCAHCGQAFKRTALALLATLLTAGGGHLYLRHRRPFVYFSFVEMVAGILVGWQFWYPGAAALAGPAVWLASASMIAFRALAWFHWRHLLREYVPCQPRPPAFFNRQNLSARFRQHRGHVRQPA